MLQLHNRNVNEFVGAFISPPVVYVCMRFCPKGSVWDVINQKSILLSWDFRLSLIIDIAKVILVCMMPLYQRALKWRHFSKSLRGLPEVRKNASLSTFKTHLKSAAYRPSN